MLFIKASVHHVIKNFKDYPYCPSLRISYFWYSGLFFRRRICNPVFYIYLVPSIAILAYFGSKLVFKQELSKIDKSATLAQKFAKYQAASILKFALIEGAALLALVEFMSTRYSLYFTIAICLVAYLAFQNPTKNKLITNLQLKPDEQNQV